MLDKCRKWLCLSVILIQPVQASMDEAREQPNPRILIVGAGIACLATATELRENNITPDIIEKRFDAWPQKTGIVLQSNAIHAFAIISREQELMDCCLMNLRNKSIKNYGAPHIRFSQLLMTKNP